MAKPNKAGFGAGRAVARNMRERGAPTRQQTPFWAWFWQQVATGRAFDSVEQAQAEFDAEPV